MKTDRLIERYMEICERYNKCKVIRVQIPAINTTTGMAQVHPGASQLGFLLNSAGTAAQEHYRKPLCWRCTNTEA